MDYWISCAYDASAYKSIIDSLNAKNTNLELETENYSVLIVDAKNLLNGKNQLIEAQTKEVLELNTQLGKERRLKRIWKQATIVLSGATLGVILIKSKQ